MSPMSLDPHHARDYRRRGRPLVLLGFLCLSAGLGALVDPSAAGNTTVAQLVTPTVELTWQLAYTVGGALMVIGVLALRPDVESLGLRAVGAALAINFVALVIVRGLAGAGAALGALALSGWVIAGRLGDLRSAARRDRRRSPRP